MLPRLIVAMPRGAAQVSLTVPAMYGLMAPLAAFSVAINMAVAFTVAPGMRPSGEGSGELAFIYLAATRCDASIRRGARNPHG